MRNIGVPVEPPQGKCEDLDCPFHSNLSVRGRILEGTVVSDSMKETVIIRRGYYHYVPKYLRYERRRSRIAAHNPPCIDAKVGDRVKIMECRPLSKSVSFVVIEKMGEK
jgi:small subunit ribosomal protein S17